jgi:hypothetical protein
MGLIRAVGTDLHSRYSLLDREPEFAQCTKDGSAALAFDRRVIAQAIRIHHCRGAAGLAGKFRHQFQLFRGRVIQ